MTVLCWIALALVHQSSGPSGPVLRVEVTSGSKPVPGALVRAGSVSGTTGPDGSVTTPVQPGSVTIAVTREGFLPATTTVDIDSPREWIVQVELEAAEGEDEEITVYATRNDIRIQDSPLRVEVLEREEIEEKMLMTPGDIVMMLNEMGGMRVQTTSPSMGASSVRMQGMRGRYTRFLSDGLPLFGQQGAGLGLLQIPPIDLGQVEVIKGTASALYGSGAMAGVVNLVSRRPAKEPVRELLLNRTSLGGTDAAAFLSSGIGAGWKVSFLGGGHWQDQRDVDGDAWADLAGYSRGVFRPRFFWDGGEGDSAMLTGGVIVENRIGGTLPGATLPATGQPYPESMGTRRTDFGASGQKLIAGKYVLAARLSASSQTHVHRFGEIYEHDRHDLMFGEVSLRGSAGRHMWVAGTAAERDAYRSREVPRFNYTYVTPGLFAQDDIRLTRWLTVSASARADFHDRFGSFFSPRISALLQWSGWTTRVSASQGFFAPSPLTEETEAAGLTRLQIPAPLRAERGRSASVDVARSFGPLSVNATLFASTIRDPIQVLRGNRYAMGNLSEPFTNRGTELLGTWRKAAFAATASYTYVRATERGFGEAISDVPLTPRHSFGFVGVWEQEGKGRIGAECYYTGEQRLEYDPNAEVSRPYWVFGLMAERKIARFLRVFVNFENLGNVRQTRWSPLLRKSRSADGRWTVDAWAPLDGRVVNAGIRLQF